MWVHSSHQVTWAFADQTGCPRARVYAKTHVTDYGKSRPFSIRYDRSVAPPCPDRATGTAPAATRHTCVQIRSAISPVRVGIQLSAGAGAASCAPASSFRPAALLEAADGLRSLDAGVVLVDAAADFRDPFGRAGGFLSLDPSLATLPPSAFAARLSFGALRSSALRLREPREVSVGDGGDVAGPVESTDGGEPV